MELGYRGRIDNSAVFNMASVAGFIKKHSLILIIAGIVFVSMVIFWGPIDNWVWDPSFYYAQLRSPIIDGDLDFRNETQTNGIETPYTVTGLQHSPWPIGPSILWSPFFITAHLVMSLLDPIKATGFSAPYISLVSLGSSFYGALGLILVYKIARLYAEEKLAIFTTLLCLGASPLFFYIFRQPIMGHTTGFFVSAAMILVYLYHVNKRLPFYLSGLLFGVLLGLNFLTRWSGFLHCLFPLAYFSYEAKIALQERDFLHFKRIAFQVVIMAIVSLLTVSPQLALWFRFHNKWIIAPQGEEAFVNSQLPINLLNIIFHTNRGIMFWAPFVVLSMAGLFFIRNRQLKIVFILFCLLNLILIGYRVDWFSGGGFGARYFIELLPALVLGYTALVSSVKPKTMLWFGILIVSLVFVAHQSVLMFSIEHSSVPGWFPHSEYLHGEPLGVDFQWNSFLRMIREPHTLFEPRPFISENRQTIIISWLSGKRSPNIFYINGFAAIISPFLVVGAALFYKRLTPHWLKRITIAVAAYMLIWAVFILNI